MRCGHGLRKQKAVEIREKIKISPLIGARPRCAVCFGCFECHKNNFADGKCQTPRCVNQRRQDADNARFAFAGNPALPTLQREDGVLRLLEPLHVVEALQNRWKSITLADLRWVMERPDTGAPMPESATSQAKKRKQEVKEERDTKRAKDEEKKEKLKRKLEQLQEDSNPKRAKRPGAGGSYVWGGSNEPQVAVSDA